jgi:hypothetical protein
MKLISFLIEELCYKSYLEIGLGELQNFSHVRCNYKVGVDPANVPATHNVTSDEFFDKNKERFDIIFIDGLHHSDQVDKDIYNSLQCINKGGTIVVHDCNPILEEHQTYFPTVGFWTGDVWKSFVKFRQSWNLPAYVVDIDWGCGVIECDVKSNKINDFKENISWDEFVVNKNKLLGLIDQIEFKEKVKTRRSLKKQIIKFI